VLAAEPGGDAAGVFGGRIGGSDVGAGLVFGAAPPVPGSSSGRCGLPHAPSAHATATSKHEAIVHVFGMGCDPCCEEHAAPGSPWCGA
jgi:hypothetical protein